MAGYKLLLSRLTGQDDLVVGTSLAGRDHPTIEDVVGCFVKTVALRTHLDGTPSLREAVRRVHVTTMEAHDHQHISFDRIVAELNVPRDPRHSPVFQTFFGLQPDEEEWFTGAQVAGLQLESAAAKWDLTVSLTEHVGAGGVSGFAEYASDLFDEETVVAYVDMYVRLLGEMAARPDVASSDHPLLSMAQRAHILWDLNPYRRPTHRYRTMAEPFEEQVARTPDAVALEGMRGA